MYTNRIIYNFSVTYHASISHKFSVTYVISLEVTLNLVQKIKMLYKYIWISALYETEQNLLYLDSEKSLIFILKPIHCVRLTHIGINIGLIGVVRYDCSHLIGNCNSETNRLLNEIGSHLIMLKVPLCITKKAEDYCKTFVSNTLHKVFVYPVAQKIFNLPNDVTLFWQLSIRRKKPTRKVIHISTYF